MIQTDAGTEALLSIIREMAIGIAQRELLIAQLSARIAELEKRQAAPAE
jgi:hypothetical protein